MLINRLINIKNLFNLTAYEFTMKSRKQTTPNLIQNPKLTKHGIIKRIPQSYDYDLPQTLPNRHLYWDRSVQNKLYRKQFNAKRLYSLGLKPIHSQDGTRLFERNVNQILKQLGDIRVIKGSIERTLTNLAQVIIRFGKQLSEQDRQIAQFAIRQLHQRYIPSMSLHQFGSFCQIRTQAHIKPTEKIFLHFYKFVQKHSQEGQMAQQMESQGEKPIIVKKMKLKIFLKFVKYIFRDKEASYFANNQHLMYKNKELFKLFEDNDPRYKSLQELVPKVYTKKEVQLQLQDENVRRQLKWLSNIPGGQKLLSNITK